MKTLQNIIIISITLLSVLSCKKQETADINAGAVNVTNAVIGGATITMMVDQSIISGTNNTVGANASVTMPVMAGNVQLKLGVPAVAATATAVAVPSIIYYNQPITINRETIYSLFLTGPSVSAVEPVLIKENYTYKYADSVCGVRFVNLAQGNQPVMVNLKGNANGSEAASIAYKGYNDFKIYPAKKVNASYVFEFRKLDGTLITSYTLATPYFHNVTLALRGTIGGTTGVILSNNY